MKVNQNVVATLLWNVNVPVLPMGRAVVGV